MTPEKPGNGLNSMRKAGRALRQGIGTGACFLVCIGSLWSCSAPKREVTYNPGEYHQIIERQQSGITPTESEMAGTPKEKLSAQELDVLGDLYLRQGNAAMAMVQYQKAVESDPSLFHVHYKIGEMFLKKWLAQDALLHFQKVLDHDDHHALSVEGSGIAYFRIGEDKKAETSFRKAIALKPDRWQTYNFLGMLLDRQKRHQEAVDEYKRGLELQPNEAMLLNNSGLAYYLLGRHEEAVRSFERALLTRSGDAKIHNNLGLAYAKLNRHHDALESFRQTGSDEEAYNNLGVFFLSNEEPAYAIACFKKAIEISPRYYDKAYDNLKLARRILERNKTPENDSAQVEYSNCPAETETAFSPLTHIVKPLPDLSQVSGEYHH